MEIFSNIEERFLPDPEHRPLFTFGAPWIQYVHKNKPFNAAYEILDRSVNKYGGDRIAIIDGQTGSTWSYYMLRAAVNRFGNALKKIGLKPGERVLLRVPDIAEMAIAQMAVWKIGCVAVPSPVVDRAREIQFTINDTEARVAVVHEEYLDDVEQVRALCPTLNTVIVIGSSKPDYVWFAGIIKDESEVLDPYPNKPLDASGIYYTGGTTGYPKGCLHTHASEVVLSDLNNIARGVSSQDVFLTHGPIGHAFGNGEKINFPLRAGASVIYSIRPKPIELIEMAERYGATIMAGTATIYRMILREVSDPTEEFPKLKIRHALSSGEILDRPTYEKWALLFKFPLRNTVGMTPMRHLFIESNMFGAKVAPDLSVGLPLPGYEVRLVDADTKKPVEPGTPGRLAIRGPSGITYWINIHPNIKQRAEQDVVDGWSYLDDSYIQDDEGWLWFQARLDDMIVTGGRQVAAPEVEQVLGEHPAVREVAVVGVPDEVRGQIVKAYVVLREGYSPNEELVKELQDFAKEKMATYKYPREIEFIDQLPRDHVGKIQRRLLREAAARRQSVG